MLTQPQSTKSSVNPNNAFNNNKPKKIVPGIHFNPNLANKTQKSNLVSKTLEVVTSAAEISSQSNKVNVRPKPSQDLNKVLKENMFSRE